MKKIILMMASFILTNTAWALNDGFNFTECSGSGTFEQQIQHFNNDFEAAITVGSIPEGIEGLSITLSSDEDVDIRLYGHSNDKVVHWPYGLLSGATEQSTPYLGVEVTYSGYNGFGGELGHEYITVSGTTQTTMTMKAFGYKAGYAVVDYSWTGKEGCDNSGDGNFTQSIAQDALTLVGEIPAGIPNVTIELTSEKDLDIQLYSEDGTVIVGWKPIGLLSGSKVGSITYNGMNIEWSGYNGTHGNTGHEYIKISGYTTEVLTMKVYGYEAGFANVTYSWSEDDDTIHPTPTPTPQPCLAVYEPVCGEYMLTGEQETFGNMCELTNASEVAFLHEGECDITEPPTPTVTPTPQPCSEIYEPVCGTFSGCGVSFGDEDECLPVIYEQTFTNICQLNITSADFLHEGECSDNEEYNTTSQQQQLNNHLALWNSQGIDAYTFKHHEYISFPDGDYTLTQPIDIHVKNATITEAFYLVIHDTHIVPTEELQNYQTIEERFQMVQELINTSSDNFFVSYHPTFGYPQMIDIYGNNSSHRIYADDLQIKQMPPQPCISTVELQNKIINGDNITDVNTSCITNMNSLFFHADTFNQDISNWDVSNVTDMGFMFGGATMFNQDISSWDVSKVTNMNDMFAHTENFNQDISNWEVSQVNNMNGMFWEAKKFNQPIWKWNVSLNTYMPIMFLNATSFSQDLSGWNVLKPHLLEQYAEGSLMAENYLPNFIDPTL